MGVPGFFLWLKKKYNDLMIINKGKLDEKIEIHKILLDKLNNIDHLLLDTNCLIHPVCQGVIKNNPELTDYSKLEHKMIIEVIKYIELLIDITKPTKSIYIAIDGVVPYSKIKQQRQRRFKSISDKALFNSIKTKHSKDISNDWNSSAITPGTIFMDKLTKKLIKFSDEYSKKYKIKIIFSSAYTEREGEHKLIHYLKNLDKKKLGNSVIYGLDADLIFLSLSLDIDNIFLLREGSVFEKKAEDNIFNFVDIDKMKQCLQKEITESLENVLEEEGLEKDLIKVENKLFINDFIFMGYFIGNDFLPHLLSIDVYENGFDILLKNYAKLKIEFPKSNLITVKNSKINFNNKMIRTLLKNLSSLEESKLENKYLRSKPKCFSSDPYDREIFKIDNLLFKIDDPIQIGADKFEDYYKRYYDYLKMNKKDIEKMTLTYIEGLIWSSNYYFNECKSWEWYYHYNHPPFMTDIYNVIKNINLNNIEFELGNPLDPIQQLLCVLPPQSGFLLPYNCKELMNKDSELNNFYPTRIKQEYLYKRKHWQAIPLLPDLDFKKIKENFDIVKTKFNENEINRNKSIEDYVFNY